MTAFLRRQHASFRTTFNVIEWDVSEDEQHEASSKITEHPLEDGATVSDHVIENQDSLTLKLRQSNTPVISQAEAIANSDILDSRAEDTYNQLMTMKRRHEAVEAVTSLRVYESMIIESVSVVRNAALGRVLSVTVRLKQIKTAFSQTVSLPTPKDKRAKKVVDQGKKSLTPATEPVKQKTTFLLDGFDFVTEN